MNRIVFSLAGLRFTISAPASLPPVELPPEYSAFLTRDPLPAGAGYDVEPGALVPAAGTHRASWENGLVRVFTAADQPTELHVCDPVTRVWRGVARLAGDFSTGQLAPAPAPLARGTLLPFHQPHDRLILLGRLLHLQGGILHSSCVIAGGKAMLFVGSSGAGKTTIARVWRKAGATLVNDERNIIRVEGTQVIAGSSPWHGEENQVSPMSAPLAAIFYLQQAPRNSATEIPPEISASRLFRSTLVPVFLAEGPEKILESWSDVVTRVPSYELSFTPDERVVDCCLSLPGLK